MVDEDPISAQPKYITMLKIAEEQHNIRILRDPMRTHKIVVLCPRFEEWFLWVCARAGIDVTDRDFNLPTNPNELHDIINRRRDKVEKILQILLQQQNPALTFLQFHLTS